MPSGYTHIFLTKTFVERSGLSDHELGLLLSENIKYFQLGALGPDLPYSQLLGLTNRGTAKLADKFHYQYTNKIPIRAFNRIKKENDEIKKEQLFAFFLGYTAHIVADGLIHPFVRDKVGDYQENQNEHRTLEMRLDVLFLSYLTKKSGHAQNLNYTNLHDQVLDPLTSFNHISGMFSRLVFEVYGDEISPSQIEEWVRDMHNVFAVAESKNNHFYASWPVLKDYLFQDLDKLLEKSEDDLWLRKGSAKGREVNFAGRDVHFIDDCVSSFYKVFKDIALLVYDSVFNDGDKFNDKKFPAINLDTGRPLIVANGNDLNAKATFWEIS